MCLHDLKRLLHTGLFITSGYDTLCKKSFLRRLEAMKI